MTTTLARTPARPVPHRVLLLLLLMVGASGCGWGGGVGEVTGIIKFKDQPLLSGDVLFVTPDGQRKWGAIGPKGEYRVKDVPVGPVKVAVLPRSRVPGGLMVQPGQPGGKPPPADAGAHIPRRYTEPEQSGLTYTVERGAQTFHIKLVP